MLSLLRSIQQSSVDVKLAGCMGSLKKGWARQSQQTMLSSFSGFDSVRHASSDEKNIEARQLTLKWKRRNFRDNSSLLDGTGARTCYCGHFTDWHK